MKEYWTLKNIKIKDEQTDKKTDSGFFLKIEAQKSISEINGMKAEMQKYTEMCIIKTAAAAKLNTTETQKGRQKKIEKRN